MQHRKLPMHYPSPARANPQCSTAPVADTLAFQSINRVPCEPEQSRLCVCYMPNGVRFGLTTKFFGLFKEAHVNGELG